MKTRKELIDWLWEDFVVTNDREGTGVPLVQAYNTLLSDHYRDDWRIGCFQGETSLEDIGEYVTHNSKTEDGRDSIKCILKQYSNGMESEMYFVKDLCDEHWFLYDFAEIYDYIKIAFKESLWECWLDGIMHDGIPS